MLFHLASSSFHFVTAAFTHLSFFLHHITVLDSAPGNPVGSAPGNPVG